MVAPLVAKKLGELAADENAAFTLDGDGMVRWRGAPAGLLVGGAPFSPKVRLLGDLGAETVRERAQRRLEAFIAWRSTEVLHPLARLKAAVTDGSIRGLARGVAYRLIEAGGVIDRAGSAAEVAALSQGERRSLRALGVRFGAFSLFCPALLTPAARDHLAPFARLEPGISPRALSALGLRAVAGVTLPVEALERFDEAVREAPREQGGFRLTDEIVRSLDLPPGRAILVLKALGFTRAGKPVEGEAPLWRRRNPPPVSAGLESASTSRTDSPFHALCRLSLAPDPKPDSSPGRKPRRNKHLAPKTGLIGLASQSPAPGAEPIPARRRRRRRANRAAPAAAS